MKNRADDDQLVSDFFVLAPQIAAEDGDPGEPDVRLANRR